ncbi:MAG: hypothetical protein KAY32_12135 [Candidatus Eisenbacteria sp.]|nr:hypothetical protein [Candidatus Eisenbacteria bacterium]
MNGGSDEGGREQGRGTGAGEYEWVDLYPVYAAQDETAAIHVRSLLVSAGIDARIRSAQVPWLDGIMASGLGYWGQVLVPRGEVLAARALLEDLEAQTETKGGEELEGPEGREGPEGPEGPEGREREGK